MGYQMLSLLQKCEKDDVQFIIDTIDSYINFSDDAGLKEEFANWGSGKMPIAFAKKLETEIRYVGSNDIAYARRKLFGYEPAGVDVSEIIDDIAEAQKIKLKPIASVEGKVEELLKKMIQKKWSELTTEQQKELLKQFIKGKEFDGLWEKIKNNKDLIIPILIQVLGKELSIKIIQAMAVGILTQIIGKAAATALIATIAKRIPAQALGPIMWIGSTAWLAIDFTGPAMRKTLPIILMLGIVALKDGPEDESFFE